MEKDFTKVLEVTASDGIVEIFRNFLAFDKQQNPEYLYALKINGNEVNTMATSFNLFWKDVVKRINDIYIFDLQSVHDDLKIDITKNVRENIENKDFILNSNWREKLVDNPEILNSTDYFDYEYFVEKLEKFRTNIDIKYWNYIEVNHSNSKNKQEFRSVLLKKEIFPLKVSGLYAYYVGNKCFYIGKGKNIQNRLESHFLSSQNLDNLSRGAKHRKLFGKYLDDNLTIFYKELDDTFHSQIGEELRTTIERLLHLKYKPEFMEIKNE